jgi:P-type E1-E2 ATPase
MSLTAAGGGSDPAPTDEEEAESELFHSQCLPMLAAVESYSEHLLGRAILRYAGEHRIQTTAASGIEIHKGGGIEGQVEGRRLFLGNQSLVGSLGACLDEELARRALQWQEQGSTIAYFGWEGEVQGLLCFGDEIKAGAAEMIRMLHRRGIHVRIVSGDAWGTTAVTARQVGADDFTAESSPDGKARIIAEMQKTGLRVAMIGDGVNDAPALAQADLGMALGSGADIAMNAAPVVLASGLLARVEEAFHLSEKTSRIVKQNLFWAFVYNVGGISLAVAGVLSPIFAAAAMLCSSASVVGNSMRLMAPNREFTGRESGEARVA